MGRAVIIIHPSEIIRRGLSSVFEEQPAIRLLSYAELSLLKTDTLKTVSRLILIVPAGCKQSERLLELRTTVGDHIFIGLKGDNERPKGSLFDHIIPLEIPVARLSEIAQRFFAGSEGELAEELTNREKEVLRLIALGKTNKAIADILFLSTHTVISHRKNITDKLGIKSIPGLTVYAIIQKIISPSDISPDQLT